ncbi:MAG: SBBP repeat-containing protein, partial [Gammaproteobacteria bacterium]
MSQLTRLNFSPRPLVLAALGPMICPALAAAATDQTKLEQDYGKLPLSFEANQGQSNAQVKFLARGPGYTLFLTPTEAVLSLKKPQPQRKAAREIPAPSEPAGRTVLRMRLVGANPAPQISGREVLPGKVNYLKGQDPAHWHTEIPTYAKVAYAQVYPGIDLVYYGNQRQLEYDFVLAPGADPHTPTLSFEGADRLEIDTRGELVLHTAGGDLRMHKPLIYQEVEGVRQPIAGGYVRKNERQVGFEIAAYDRARPLVIDPVLVYSTYLGGNGFDGGIGIAVDDSGQAYVTGATTSTDFPTRNPLQPALGGGDLDAFVTKLNRAGSKLVYSTYLGGTDDENTNGIAVDRFGQAYVTGFTQSTDFPTQDPLQPALSGGFADAFVAKLNRTGSKLVYSTYLGGTGNDDGIGIAVHSGQAYVAGFTDSTDFPIQNPLQSAFGGSLDAFVVKLNRTGSKLVYSTYLGGTGDDDAIGIAVDHSGNAYVTGLAGSTDFPTRNPLQPGFGGGFFDAFVAKLNRAGSKLVYSTYLGGTDFDQAFGIAVDRFGQAYVTGHTASPDFPTQDPLQP